MILVKKNIVSGERNHRLFIPIQNPGTPGTNITGWLGSLAVQEVDYKSKVVHRISRAGYYEQGHPTSIFGKYLFGRRFEIYNFRNICCKISCLPASPRTFEHLKNSIFAHF